MTIKTQGEIDKEFNDWFAASFEACIKPHVKAINKTLNLLVSDIEDIVDGIQKSFDAQGADLRTIAEVIGGKPGADGKLELRKLDDVLAKMRTELREEIAVKIKSLRTTIKRDLSTHQGAASNGSNITNLPAIIRK